MARIALDAMGGDNAPEEIVAGAVVASGMGVDVVLVGDHDAIKGELDKHDARLPIVEASGVIGMGDDPGRAIREKPEASVVVAAKLVAEGSADGFLSAGSTGAALAASAVIIGRVKGVSRPPLATIFPTPVTPTMILDMGANPDVKPDQLVQFAHMGAAATSALLEVETPRVGLLSNGEEKGKGRDLEKSAYDLLSASSLRFVGNLEGRDVATDKADVIVTDGFTGNIFLKTMEGTVALLARYLREEISRLAPEIQRGVGPAVRAVKERLDYETYGGAQLLGIKGIALVAHGSSNATAIGNALAMARNAAEKDVAGLVAEAIASS